MLVRPCRSGAADTDMSLEAAKSLDKQEQLADG